MLLVEVRTGAIVRGLWRRAADLLAHGSPQAFFGGYGRSPEMTEFCLGELLAGLPCPSVVVSTNGVAAVIQEKLEARGVRVSELIGVDEVHGVFHAANLGMGMVIAAGTGTVGGLWLPDGRFSVIDGAGPLIGDWGSAYYIGHAFLRRAFREQVSQTAAMPEIAAICRQLGIEMEAGKEPQANVWRLVGHRPLYSDRSTVASLSQVCDDCARRGSELARQVLREAGEELADTAERAWRRSGMKELPGFAFLGAGSVLRHSDVVYESWAGCLREAFPWARVLRMPRPQVCGQVVGALRKLLGEQSESVVQAFFKNFQNFVQDNPGF